MGTVRKVELFFQEGTSDKVYNAKIVEDGPGTFTVEVEWGRRGSSLNKGTKAVRVSREAANKKFDSLVREKTGDASKFVSGDLSYDGRWLVLTIYNGWTSADVYFRREDGKTKEWTPLAVGLDAHFDVEAYKDELYVRTDHGAPRYRAYRVDPKHPERAAWKEIVPERRHA